MAVEGPLPPGMNGGTVGIVGVGVGLPLMGSIFTMVCAMVLGPLARMLVMM